MAVSTSSQFQLRVPRGSALQLPTGRTLKYLALGVGTQNYVCGKDKTTLRWLPHGAEASLLDVSKAGANASTLPDLGAQGGRTQVRGPDLKDYRQLGKHFFFRETPGSDMSPIFDFSNEKLGKLVMQKVNAVNAPRRSDRNVAWLQLRTLEGDFAAVVYRTSTRGGQPPLTDCINEKEVIKRKYLALYSFWL